MTSVYDTKLLHLLAKKVTLTKIPPYKTTTKFTSLTSHPNVILTHLSFFNIFYSYRKK